MGGRVSITVRKKQGPKIMNATQLSKLIGRRAVYPVYQPTSRRKGSDDKRPLIALPVTVVDARSMFGRADVQIQALADGCPGTIWVSLASLLPQPDAEP
jgi:hypothetical protein